MKIPNAVAESGEDSLIAVRCETVRPTLTFTESQLRDFAAVARHYGDVRIVAAFDLNSTRLSNSSNRGSSRRESRRGSTPLFSRAERAAFNLSISELLENEAIEASRCNSLLGGVIAYLAAPSPDGKRLFALVASEEAQRSSPCSGRCLHFDSTRLTNSS